LWSQQSPETIWKTQNQQILGGQGSEVNENLGSKINVLVKTKQTKNKKNAYGISSTENKLCHGNVSRQCLIDCWLAADQQIPGKPPGKCPNCSWEDDRFSENN